MPVLELKTKFEKAEWRIAKDANSYHLTGMQGPVLMLFLNDQYICFLPKEDLEMSLDQIKKMETAE